MSALVQMGNMMDIRGAEKVDGAIYSEDMVGMREPYYAIVWKGKSTHTHQFLTFPSQPQSKIEERTLICAYTY